MKEPKVFGIGFHKTATTSLAQALEILGYRVTGPNGIRDPQIAENAESMAMRLAGEFDAFQDNPWPLLYRQMDEAFPGSKFILTLRSEEQWINSQVKHFGKKSTPMRQWIYGVGCPEGNESVYLQRYREHNGEVQEYFRNRESDLLIMRITEGDGWNLLCPFLGLEIPDVSFPNENKAGERTLLSRLSRKLEKLFPR